MKLHESLEILNITESINNKGNFKAIFLSGSPGSGKSFFVKKALTGMGFRVINPDKWFEKKMKEGGLSLKNLEDPKAVKLQKKSIDEVMPKIVNTALDLRQPVIIDRTGANASSVLKLKKKMESLGYDTKMFYIKTKDDVAEKRNQNRERTVSGDYLKHARTVIPKNQEAFKKAFGSDYAVIDNTPPFNDEKEKEWNKLFSKVKIWFDKKPSNKKVTEWENRMKQEHKKRVSSLK